MKTSWHCVILTRCCIWHTLDRIWWLWQCDNIIGECHHSGCHWHWLVAGADHLPIYGTGPIWCVPGCVYNGRCDRDHRWPLEARGNFPITCHGPSQNSATETKTLANTQSWPPPPLHAGPITGHWPRHTSPRSSSNVENSPGEVTHVF